MRDLRLALRQLRKAPGFSLTIVVTLALGIGATTAVFSLVEGVLLRPLPFRDPRGSAFLAAVLAMACSWALLPPKSLPTSMPRGPSPRLEPGSPHRGSSPVARSPNR